VVVTIVFFTDFRCYFLVAVVTLTCLYEKRPEAVVPVATWNGLRLWFVGWNR
jgi:hypothetical protein